MLRAHIDDELVGAEDGRLEVCKFGCGVIRHSLLAAFDSEILANPRRVLRKDVVILAQRVALPLVRKQNAFQIWMPGKDDAEHVEYFALHPICGKPNAAYGRHEF